MSGRRVTNASGSSNALRGDVLRTLGVLKMATADQIQRLSSPHLTYRHTAKKTPAQRKEARTASHRAAANDLRRCRWLWNECCARSKKAHAANEECGPARLDKMLTGARACMGWLREGSSVPQQQVIRDFAKSRAKAL
ncbi:hypothetical protein ABZT15_48730, partial [Streptomyces sp. NPDC005507]